MKFDEVRETGIYARMNIGPTCRHECQAVSSAVPIDAKSGKSEPCSVVTYRFFTFWADNRGQDSELRIRAIPRVSLGQRLLASVFARGRSHPQGLNATDTLQNGDTLPLNQ